MSVTAPAPPIPVIPVILGEFRVSDQPQLWLSTLLGSCIAACFWDARARVGGMNHFLLAEDQGRAPGAVDIRYGVHAMEVLINALLRAGATRDGLQAKLFGGAKMADGLQDIGRRNADFAQAFLATEGIPCLAASLGGRQARRVLFQPASGAARQLRLPQADLPTGAPDAARATGEIQLF